MVGQVLPDRRIVDEDGDLERLENLSIADPRVHQDDGRVHRTCGQDNLFVRSQVLQLACKDRQSLD